MNVSAPGASSGSADTHGQYFRPVLSASCGACRMYGYGARREADYVVNLRGMNRNFDDLGRSQDAVPGVAEMQPVSAP